MFNITTLHHIGSASLIALPLALSSPSVAEADELPDGLNLMKIGTPHMGYTSGELQHYGSTEVDFDEFHLHPFWGNWIADAAIALEFFWYLKTSVKQTDVHRHESGYEIDFSIDRREEFSHTGQLKTFKQEVLLSQYVDYETTQPTEVTIKFDRITPGIWSERGALVVVTDQNGTIFPEFVSIPVASQWRYELPADSVGRIEVWHSYVYEGTVLPDAHYELLDREELRIRISFSNPADINGDGVIDGQDMAAVLGTWGRHCPGCAEDIDNDGIVSGSDLTMILAGWNPGFN